MVKNVIRLPLREKKYGNNDFCESSLFMSRFRKMKWFVIWANDCLQKDNIKLPRT